MELLFLLVLFLQDPPTALPFKHVLPPDLIHVESPSCNLIEHGVSEVLDAKTGEVTAVVKWRVEPFASYDDHREQWELPQEPLPHTKGVTRPGAIADVDTGFEALAVCQDWRREVKSAVKEAKRKAVKK
jgi:hypothetical protein